MNLIGAREDLDGRDLAAVDLIKEAGEGDLGGLTPLIEPALGQEGQSENGHRIDGQGAKGAVHVAEMLRHRRINGNPEAEGLQTPDARRQRNLGSQRRRGLRREADDKAGSWRILDLNNAPVGLYQAFDDV